MIECLSKLNNEQGPILPFPVSPWQIFHLKSVLMIELYRYIQSFSTLFTTPLLSFFKLSSFTKVWWQKDLEMNAPSDSSCPHPIHKISLAGVFLKFQIVWYFKSGQELSNAKPWKNLTIRMWHKYKLVLFDNYHADQGGQHAGNNCWASDYHAFVV